jgi:hypothetical protein
LQWGLAMLTFDNFITFTKNEDPPVVLRNFWETEDGFVWSRGKWNETTFDFDLPRKPFGTMAELILDLDVYKNPDSLPGQNVLIYLNGLRLGSSFVIRRFNYIAPFDPAILRAVENVLIIDTPDAASPKDHGMSDSRQLGVQLFSLQIRKIG